MQVMRLGVHRLWCPETINELIGIDDRYVAARGHQSLFVWDHRDGKLVDGIDARSITCGSAPVTIDVGKRHFVRVSADGRWVAAANIGSRIRIFDATTGAMKFRDDPEYAYDAVAFSPDGASIVATADGAYVWSDTTLRRVAGVHRNARIDAAGDIVGGAHQDRVGRWGIDGTELARISVRGKVDSLSISTDGRYGSVTTYGTGGLCMFPMPDVVVADFARGRAILRFRDEVDDVTRVAMLSPDARWVALVGEAGTRLSPLEPLPPWTTPVVVAKWEQRAIALSGDGHALRADDSSLELVAIPNGDVLARARLDDTTSHCWSSDNRLVVELSRSERTIRFRDARTLAVTRERAFDHPINAFAMSPDDTRIAVTDAATIIVTTVVA